jgi:hypothetical protein
MVRTAAHLRVALAEQERFTTHYLGWLDRLAR